MNWLKRLFSRGHSHLYDDLPAEIQSHIEEKTAELVADGMSAEDAWFAARREFGNAALIEEQSRAVWGWSLFETLIADIRFGLRQVRRNPSVMLVAVLSLALGIGANLTVFLILYGVLLRPLPFPHPEQLVRVERFYPDGNLGQAYPGTEILFMSRNSHAFGSVAAYVMPNHVNLVQDGEAVPLQALPVTSDFFHVFQMEPRIGHGFSSDDMASHAPWVVVLSDETWRQRFAADPNIVGRAITLGNEKYTVIGVANPKFRLDTKVDLWTPLRIVEGPNDKANIYLFVARLKPGATRSQAEDDMKRVLLELKNVYPHLWDQNESARVFDYQESRADHRLRLALETLMGAVGLLLLIVSANILSLLLTRAMARRREMSLRVALGASGWRVLQQLLVENAILCVLGGCAGVLFAKLAVPVLMRLSPIELPYFTSLDLGGTSLLFVAILAIGCAFLFSLVPAWESRRTQLNDGLRLNSARVAGGRNLPQKFLVVGEVATSLVLLFAAALLLNSFWRMVHVSPGFATNVLTFKTTFTNEQATTSDVFSQRLNQLAGRLEAQPGIASAAATWGLPTQLVPDLDFVIIGRRPGDPDANGDEKYIPITAHYFDALRIPLVAGRIFGPSDTQSSASVVIVNQQFARLYFHGANPVGEHIRIGADAGTGFEDSIREIIGVVGDTKQDGLDARTPGIMYLPAGQINDSLTQLGNRLLGMSWVVRTKVPGINVAGAARQIFMEDAHTPLLSVETMQDVMRASVAQQRFSMFLLSAFGLIALVLAGAGLYGVMSYTVARRTKEIGIRMAIGAQRSDVSRMVMREAGLLIGAGIVVGVAASLAGAQILRSLLFGVAPRDPGRAHRHVRRAVAHRIVCRMVARPARRVNRTDGCVAGGINRLLVRLSLCNATYSWSFRSRARETEPINSENLLPILCMKDVAGQRHTVQSSRGIIHGEFDGIGSDCWRIADRESEPGEPASSC